MMAKWSPALYQVMVVVVFGVLVLLAKTAGQAEEEEEEVKGQVPHQDDIRYNDQVKNLAQHKKTVDEGQGIGSAVQEEAEERQQQDRPPPPPPPPASDDDCAGRRSDGGDARNDFQDVDSHQCHQEEEQEEEEAAAAGGHQEGKYREGGHKIEEGEEYKPRESRGEDRKYSESEGNREEPTLKASGEEEAVGALPVLLAALTAGIIFFALGFFIHRFTCKDEKENASGKMIRMKPIYSKMSSTPAGGDEADLEPKMAGEQQATPQIIYTVHDEPDGMKEPEIEAVRAAPVESVNKATKIRKPTPTTGKFQSPIDIDPEEAEISFDLERTPLAFKYVPENTKSLTNTGTTVKINVDCRGSDLHGGPLGDNRYCLDHIHFHWGADDNRGSEHSVAGKRYEAEIHLVHWNKEEFRSFAEAVRYDTGLAVIGVFMQVSDEEHTALRTLTDTFKSIRHKGESVEVPHHYFEPASLFPNNVTEYWTYPGSLTTPPYNESVTWIVMKEPVKVSRTQMAAFRELRKYEKGDGANALADGSEPCIVDNYREPRPLGDRSVRASFH